MVRLEGFRELKPLDEALDRFFKRLQPKRLGTLFVRVDEALGRVTARNIIAERSLPSFDRSAVDGYALRARTGATASQFQPKTFLLVEKEILEEGETKEVWTGNALPKGADAVVMLEHTKRIHDRIEVSTPLSPNMNVSKKGEDVMRGEIAVSAKTRLKPQHLGLLAAIGKTEVEVVQIPKAAIIATGTELIKLGEKQRPHKIVEVNSIILSGMCSELGVKAFRLGIVGDDEKEIAEKIRQGLAAADAVITTGGTSVGLHDLVPAAIKQIDSKAIVVHGVAIRPGMPTALAVVKNKPVLILSGNPVAAAVGFEVFGRPLFKELLGLNEIERIRVKAKMTRRVAGVLGRRVFLRVRVLEKDDQFFAQPIRIKGSGIITTMTSANGYVIIPEDREGLKENEQVTVHLFDALLSE